MSAKLLIDRGDLRSCRVAEAPAPALEPGQALLRVASFGMTANNVTYAVLGEAMSYWDFFPSGEEGWGCLPVWGFAEVERSEAEGVEVGARLFGYLPCASHLVVTPGGIGAAGFVDAAPHRAALPSAYHRLLATGADRFYRPDTEAIQMLLRPLFFTSFLIDDQLADEGYAARGPVLISSASSKTALAAAFMLRQRPGVELVGLTSPRSVELVTGLGIYDRVLPYGEVESLPVGPASFVDVAGDAAVRAAVHRHYGDELVHSMAVGVTHWEGSALRGGSGAADGQSDDTSGAAGAGEPGASDNLPGAGDLPGPAPQFFFAPTRVKKRGQDWGRAGLEQRVADAWGPFCEWAAGWLTPRPVSGLDAARDAYLDVLEGRADPRSPRVIEL